jgi:hypothetical protein
MNAMTACRRWATTLKFSLAVAFIINGRHAGAGGGPQNVALVVNPDDVQSLGIANYYVELRRIPASNVIYIPWRLDIAAATGVQFRDKLLKPLLAELEQRGIAEQIEVIAYSSGFPYMIDCAPLFRGQEFPRHARPATSLTSATFYFQSILNGDADMFSMRPHEYFAPTVGGKTTSRAFSSGAPGAPADGGTSGGLKDYYLSTALGVTHGHGNTPAEITAALRRSHEADATKPRGTIYYMQNKDVRSKVRQEGFAGAIQELAAIGVKGVVQEGIVPASRPDVMGLTTGFANVELAKSASKLLPGALVDNLTSAGAQMLIRQENNPQTRISEYIRLGAAGASGTVVEPLAIAEKFPTPALHVHYARGCSLAEAYYQSVASPFHLLIIGDPLCQPWATRPKVSLAGANDGGTLSGTAELKPTAAYPVGRAAGRFELFVDGVGLATAAAGESFTLDTSKLADGWHELRVAAIDNTPIAVQGEWIGTVQVKNGVERLELKHFEGLRTTINGRVILDLTSTVKADAQVMHNGRAVGTAAGGSGRVEIPARVLGKGRSVLYAEQRGTPPLRSKPVTIAIY